MAEHPAALQLRLLQTVVEVPAEKNSTLVLPYPVELLRFLERATPQSSEHADTRSQRRRALPCAASNRETLTRESPRIPNVARRTRRRATHLSCHQRRDHARNPDRSRALPPSKPKSIKSKTL
ncbi:MAG: rane protease subunit, stomatin/prohibitin [Mycobacterium sp.]|jgi:hypothetical protein|nr:rane protease subunit, stomatin/prohibitin [Mycobacterium sp.]